MPKATRDLTAFEKRLRALSEIKVSSKQISTASFDKAAVAAQRLQQQQQRLGVAAQELANRQERARQATERLAKAQQKATKLTSTFDKQLQQNARAAESLQRQRSAGIIRQLRDQEKAQERAAKAFQDRFITLGGIFERLGQGLSSLGSRLTVALTAPLAALGVAAVQSAIGIDAQVNTLKAFTGSAEAAEQRLSQLIATAQRTPGLTTSLGLMLDSQLRLANVTVETIDKVLPAIGRLNAVQQLQDPARFSQNLVQLVTQNFERIDLKELVGQSPIAGQIIKELFNVDSPINAEAIRESAKKMGLTTTDAFFTAFAEAAARNSALASVTESIATRFAKLVDRVTIALRPLGIAIIDSITPFVNFLIPIIEGLGRGFADLPRPIQLVVVALGALAASAGPALFILGSMISTVGSLIGAYARLVELGLTPTIKGFQLLVQVMRGSAALTAGQAATTAAAAAGWVALGGVIVVAIAAIAGAFLLFSGSQKEAVKVSQAQLDVMDRQINGLKQQAKFLDGLKTGVERTTQEQARLSDIYDELNVKAQVRVEGIKDEEQRLKTLREELGKLIKLREQERAQQAANLAGSLGDTLAQIDANEKEIQSITARVQANTELAEAIRSTGQVTTAQSQQLARQSINASNATEAIAGLQSESENLVLSQKELRDTTEELNGTAKEQAATLRVLQRQTGLSARELLTAARAMGVFRGDVESALITLERFTAGQKDAASATRTLTDAISEQTNELLKAGNQASELQKQRKQQIAAAVDLAREASDSLEDAGKFLRAFIAAQPDLRAAIEKERKLAGQSLEEFIADALGGKSLTRSGNQLRDAQEKLSKALADIALAKAEQLGQIEQQGIEGRQRINENGFKLGLQSLHEYLTTRALLTKEALQLEVNEQKAIVDAAIAEQQRFLSRAKQTGIKAPERTKAEAGAKEAEERAVKAQTKILELTERQKQADEEVTQALAEHALEQERNLRQLQIEYAELTNRIEDALNAATDERFRETLQQLALDQETLNKRIAAATRDRKADELETLKRARERNQADIETINNIITQERATNRLAVAQRLVENAQRKQSELERQIAFDVEFRGLAEEDAIKRRLDGERQLADSLRLSRDIIQQQIDALNAQGLKPPQALLDFIKEINGAVQGLGELPFSEQFRLAQQEFDRINDLRIQKIQDIERAVRNRDIAEVEGAILIRRINGQYVGDLEKQLALLKAIAKESKDRGLQQQAASTEEVVKDAKDDVASLGKQIAAAGKDAARSGLSDFFQDLLNRSKDAKTAALDLLDSIVRRVNEVIAENLSQKLFESLFGGPEDAGGGLFGKIGRLLGLGGGEAAAKTTETAAATAALTTGATTAGAALTTGGTAAATALTTGGATASATLVSSMAASAAAFAAAVTAAGAAFAASVVSSSGAQALGGLGGALGAATGMFPSVPGGAIHIVEGGYPEAVLTTDPKHAARQFQILRAYLAKTKGLFGRIPQQIIPQAEAGGFFSPRQIEMDLLSTIQRAPSPTSIIPASSLAGGGSSRNRNVRFVFVDDQRDIRNFVNSAEGEEVIVQRLIRNTLMKRSFKS